MPVTNNEKSSLYDQHFMVATQNQINAALIIRTKRQETIMIFIKKIIIMISVSVKNIHCDGHHTCLLSVCAFLVQS